MKMKRIAIRGLIIVAIVVALCMFLSGTIANITTPKVKLVTVSNGKLTENVKLKGKLNYTETEDKKIELPSGTTLTLNVVNVRPGSSVKKDDVLFEAEVTGYEDAIKTAQSEYNSALDELMELEQKNSDLQLRKSDENYANAYYALRDALRNGTTAHIRMNTELESKGHLYTPEGYPEGADDEEKKAIDNYRKTVLDEEQARINFDAYSRRGIESNEWSYLSSRQKGREKLAQCEDKLQQLDSLNFAASAIKAPHDGYISAVKVERGASYDGKGPLYTITTEKGEPVVRCDLSNITQNVVTGLKAVANIGSNTVDTKVGEIGYDKNGNKYADIILTRELITLCGGMNKMTENETEFTVQIKAKETTSLLPTTAIRGSGKDRYVYVARKQQDSFGSTTITLSKTPVTVIAETDGTASIEQSLSNEQIACMEDRPIDENSTVMEYKTETT